MRYGNLQYIFEKTPSSVVISYSSRVTLRQFSYAPAKSVTAYMQRLKQLAKAACLESSKLSPNFSLMKKRKFRWYGKRLAYVSPILVGATTGSFLLPSKKLWLMPPSCHRKKSESHRSQSKAYRIRNSLVMTTALYRQSANQGRFLMTYQSGRVSLQCFLTLSMRLLCHLFSNHSSSRTMKTQLGRFLCSSTKSLSSLVPNMIRLASVCSSTLKWSRQYQKLRLYPPFSSPLLIFHSPVIMVEIGLFPLDARTETTSNRVNHIFISKQYEQSNIINKPVFGRKHFRILAQIDYNVIIIYIKSFFFWL